MKSKIFFLTCGILAFLTLEVKAQEFKFGIQTGIGISKITTENQPEFTTIGEEADYKIAYSLNAYIGYKSKKIFGLSIEPGYIQKGAVFTNGFQSASSFDLNLNYFQLPVLIDFHINNSFVVSIGPEFSFLTSAKAKWENGNTTSFNSFYNNSDLAGLISVQFNISQHITTGVRFNRSLKPVSSINFTDDNGQPLGELKRYNHYFQALFRYTI